MKQIDILNTIQNFTCGDKCRGDILRKSLILIFVFSPWRCFFFLPWGFSISLSSVAPPFILLPVRKLTEVSHVFTGYSQILYGVPITLFTLSKNCKDSWGVQHRKKQKSHLAFSHSVHRSLRLHPNQKVISLESRGREKEV